MLGSNSNRAMEMDSKLNGSNEILEPRSFPQVSNLLIVGGDSDTPNDHSAETLKGLVHLREGTGGIFKNVILANTPKIGVHQDSAKGNSQHRTEPDITLYNYDYADLYWSRNNIIHLGNGANTGGNTLTKFDLDTDCAGFTDALNDDPKLMSLPNNALETLTFIDPRPEPDTSNPAFTNVDDIPDDGFFDQVDFKGAFGTDLWLAGWSMLSERKLIPDNVMPDEILKGDITAEKTLDASKTYFMTEQVFVRNGASSLSQRVPPSSPSELIPSVSSTLVIEQGAKITAKGTASGPSPLLRLCPRPNPHRNVGWCHPARQGPHHELCRRLDGLHRGSAHWPGTYGGNAADDNSGTMSTSVSGTAAPKSRLTTRSTVHPRRRRLRHHVGPMRLHTTTTTASSSSRHANVKYLSVLFCGDDGIDTDQGYRGKIQYAVVATKDGHHTLEMDSKENTANDAIVGIRSHPQLYNALLIGGSSTSSNVAATSVSEGKDPRDGLARFREGTGGSFGNIVMVNAPGDAFIRKDAST